MNAIAKTRRLALFLFRAAPIVDAIGLLLISLFLLQYLPRDVLNPKPASGGDMGSHFWPLDVFVTYGFHHGSLRTWNPGNLAGEPHLLNYFPTPFLFMAALVAVFPAGLAFNLGTLLPLFLLPGCCYVMGRGMGLRFPVPLLMAAATLPFLYNEGNSMWGGNALSLLAGQFAHEYALCFLLLVVGALHWEMRARRLPLITSLFSALVATSHGYVLFALPLLAFSVLCFSTAQPFRMRLVFVCQWALLTLCLSVWHIIPLLQNSAWTTPYALVWVSPEILKEVFPPVFYLPLAILFFSLVLLLFVPRIDKRLQARVLFWVFPILGYGALYFVFPRVGLVDVRAMPQIQLFCCVLAALLGGELLRRQSKVFGYIAVLPLVVLVLWWTDMHVQKLPFWFKWNYSGWESKKLYPNLAALTADLHGTFSDPRVLYEHNKANEAAGSLRVFEMLPYFSGRATLESVYLQASVVSPEIFYLQALASETPSCPFEGYPCPRVDLKDSEDKLQLFAVGDVLGISDQTVAQADASEYLKSRGSYGPWHWYQLKEKANFAGLFNRPPKLFDAPFNDFQKVFYAWFADYKRERQMIVVPVQKNSQLPRYLKDENIWAPNPTCRASVEVQFNELKLHTTCPGKAHFLKFGFYPNWQADTGDELFMVSPGFIGIVPSSETVTITFESNLWWQASLVVSALIAVLVLAGICNYARART